MEERLLRLARLNDHEKQWLDYAWEFWARPSQLAPEGDWRFWAMVAGRGFGKTRTGAETTRARVESSRSGRIALIAPTAADARDVMVEGPSGILAVSPPWFRPDYEPSKRRVTWPNGAQAFCYSGEEPDRLRGPQHDFCWADELAAWKYARETWDMLLFGLRVGADPRAVITATPKPISLLTELIANPMCCVTRGTSYENRDNLAPAFFAEIVSRYEGTRLGRQELMGELLEDVPGALWTRTMIDGARVSAAPEMKRIVVAIDPAVTSGEKADETGIIVSGIGIDGEYYVLADRSCRLSPDGWARRAVEAFREFEADRIVAEVNNGGELVEQVLRTIDARIPYRAVHASKGKRVRAEPIAALYEQGRCHHVGSFLQLEDQMVAMTLDGYAGSGSPDRLDALVWAVSDLLGGIAKPGLKISSAIHSVSQGVIPDPSSGNPTPKQPGRSSMVF